MNLDKIKELWEAIKNVPKNENNMVDKEQAEAAWLAYVNYAKEHPEEQNAFFAELDTAQKDVETAGKEFEKKQKVYMNGDIIITDPCYVIKDELWHIFCDKWFAGKTPAINWLKDVLGFKECLVADTLYGDWGCTTLQVSKLHDVLDAIANGKGADIEKIDPTVKPIGSFCADAGLVCVFYLDDCLKHNRKEVEELLTKDWCATVIRDFKGYVSLADITVKYYSDYYKKEMTDVERNVIGEGNINFIGTQTSL